MYHLKADSEFYKLVYFIFNLPYFFARILILNKNFNLLPFTTFIIDNKKDHKEKFNAAFPRNSWRTKKQKIIKKKRKKKNSQTLQFPPKSDPTMCRSFFAFVFRWNVSGFRPPLPPQFAIFSFAESECRSVGEGAKVNFLLAWIGLLWIFVGGNWG